MPFTFSHPAVVLPLCLLPRNWVSVTGLVVGSLVPDFEKFLKMAPGNTVSHTWEGIFWFNLPLGILVAFLFHGVVRNPLIHNLPWLLKRRFLRFETFNWSSYFRKKYAVVCLSILIGATSHIAWDSITHYHGLGVQLFPFLKEKVWFLNDRYTIYNLLYTVGSVVGVICIFLIILFLPPERKNEVHAVADKRWGMYWPVAAVTAFLVLLVRGALSEASEVYWNIIISSISATLIGLIVSSSIIKYKLK